MGLFFPVEVECPRSSPSGPVELLGEVTIGIRSLDEMPVTGEFEGARSALVFGGVSPCAFPGAYELLTLSFQ